MVAKSLSSVTLLVPPASEVIVNVIGSSRLRFVMPAKVFFITSFPYSVGLVYLFSKLTATSLVAAALTSIAPLSPVVVTFV